MVDKKITELGASTSLAQADVFPVVDIGSNLTKKITIANIEAGLTISGALVADIADLVVVSGASVAVSGALVADIANLVVVSGATVTNAANTTNLSGVVVVVSGAGVTNTTNTTNLSGVVVAVSGAGVTHEADSTNPHGTTLTQTNISSTGLISGTTLIGVVGDHGGSELPQLINVVYSSGPTPPTASTTTEGTLFLQYDAA